MIVHVVCESENEYRAYASRAMSECIRYLQLECFASWPVRVAFDSNDTNQRTFVANYLVCLQ